MSAFTLDTSGEVLTGNLCPHPTCGVGFEWSDLDPFTQGYVEALFASLHQDYGDRLKVWTGAHYRWDGFSDLSPEALAMILWDCAYGAGLFAGEIEAIHGAELWMRRQRGDFLQFPMSADKLPPLNVSLGVGGKVHLKQEIAK